MFRQETALGPLFPRPQPFFLSLIPIAGNSVYFDLIFKDFFLELLCYFSFGKKLFSIGSESHSGLFLRLVIMMRHASSNSVDADFFLLFLFEIN